ncbi:helix-turn-helix domain-containing protein [Actinomycetes bacterium KLBMP 9797]
MRSAERSWWTEGVFEGRPVRHLLAKHDIGAVFRFLKTRGWSRAAIAAATGLSETRVRAVAQGKQQIASYDVLARIAAGLNIERGLLGLAYLDNAGDVVRSSPTQQGEDGFASLPASGPADRNVSDRQPARPATADDKRRSLLSAVALLVATSGFLGGAEPTRTRRLGASDVARLDAILALYRSMDSEVGSGALWPEVAHLAESASALLDPSRYSCANSLKPRLLASVAATRQLAGWMAFDSGRHSDAQRHLLVAERTAVSSGDMLLAAHVRYAQARQFQHLHHHRDAIDTVRLAHDHMGTAATPAISARLYGTEATSLAALGDARTAQAMLTRAWEAFDRIKPDREPEWIRFYDHGELPAEHAATYRELARRDRGGPHGAGAAQYYTDAVAAFGPQQARSSVLNEVGLCGALFLADQPDRAVAVGEQALHHASHLTSRRVFDRIRSLRVDFAGHLTLPDVAAFSRKIASLATTRA